MTQPLLLHGKQGFSSTYLDEVARLQVQNLKEGSSSRQPVLA
jgi:hypothetical protein